MPVSRFISGLLVLLCGGAVVAADRTPATPPPETIVITSQSLVFKNQENTAVFDGKVVMTKVNFTMHADHMIVYFEGNQADGTKSPKIEPPAVARSTGPALPTLGNRAVSLIEAMGNVMMEQSGKKARSKKAVYSQRDEKLVLTGEPQVWEQGYHVTGVRMTMFLKEDRSIVEDSRVIINETDSEPR